MSNFLVYPNLKYGAHEKNKIDLFVPENIINPPFVVLVHGGGWSGGGKEQYRQTAMILAEAGIASATIGYRLMPDAVWPEIVFDVMRGCEFLLNNARQFHINPTKVVTWGSSAGGHSALLMQAYAKSWVQKRIISAAPEILGTIAQCPVVRFEKPFPELEVKTKYLNGYNSKEVCPIEMDAKLFNNVFLHQGDTDDTTPIDAAIAFIDNIKKVGNQAELLVLPGAVHGYGYNTLNKDSQKSIEMAIPFIFKLFKN